MKKWFIGVAVTALMLTACGMETEQEQARDVTSTVAYTGTDEFAHEMEDVHVVLNNYMVETLLDVTEEQQQLGFVADDIVMTATLTVQNDTTAPIYYSPNFYMYVGNEMITSAEMTTESVTIAPGESAGFNETYRIPKALYEAEKSAVMQVPAAFNQPNSTSSGDALGDFGEWTLPIK